MVRRLRGASQRRSLQTLEASHAIFGDQNGSGLAWNSHRLACYAAVVAVIARFAPLLFFRRVRKLRALLARCPVFSLLFTYRERGIGAAIRSVCALHASHSSACSWVLSSFWRGIEASCPA